MPVVMPAERGAALCAPNRLRGLIAAFWPPTTLDNRCCSLSLKIQSVRPLGAKCAFAEIAALVSQMKSPCFPRMAAVNTLGMSVTADASELVFCTRGSGWLFARAGFGCWTSCVKVNCCASFPARHNRIKQNCQLLMLQQRT